jgi:hypothetical protein
LIVNVLPGEHADLAYFDQAIQRVAGERAERAADCNSKVRRHDEAPFSQ